jgi:hypothetical protein
MRWSSISLTINWIIMNLSSMMNMRRNDMARLMLSLMMDMRGYLVMIIVALLIFIGIDILR